MIESGMTTVWAHIEEELHKRRLKASWLGRKLAASRQVVSGWKVRGVPAGRYEDIAALFGWTIDRLVNGPTDDPQPAPANDPAVSYSPIAMDVARLFDEIPSELHRAKAYAYVMQLSRGNAQESAPPKQTDSVPVSPAQKPSSTPRLVK